MLLTCTAASVTDRQAEKPTSVRRTVIGPIKPNQSAQTEPWKAKHAQKKNFERITIISVQLNCCNCFRFILLHSIFWLVVNKPTRTDWLVVCAACYASTVTHIIIIITKLLK